MAYRVFISHSARDQWLIIALANLLAKFGLEPFVAEWYLTPGEHLDEKMLAQIEKADCIVVLLTKNGIRSNWVQHEIGYALNSGKPLIPLVEKGIRSGDLGALQGREWIEYDPSQPQEALLNASTYVKSLELRRRDREKALLVAGGILAFLLLLSGEER
ncbi:MAG: toll/interleukin-1 receptor domain-containing protein [Nitrospinota bacterium]